MDARRPVAYLVGAVIVSLAISPALRTPDARGQSVDRFRFETLAHRGGASKAVAVDGDRVLLGEGEQMPGCARTRRRRPLPAGSSWV